MDVITDLLEGTTLPSEERHMIRLMPRIAVDPAIRHGKPIIEGTRVPVHVVVGHIAAGEPIDDVAREFGIAREDVLAALAYAAQTVAAEEIRAV